MKNTNKVALILFLLLGITTAFALTANDYSISSHTITIQINPQATDTVSEKYYLNFNSENAKKEFRSISNSLDNLITEWTKNHQLVTPSLGEKAANKKITYVEGNPGYLEITYDLPTPLMYPLKEATMQTEYALKIDYFNSFYTSNQWVIQDNTTINIELPAGADISKEIKPQAQIKKNGPRTIVTWNGYKNGTELTLNYVLWKQIEPVIDINELIDFLFTTQEGLILISIIIIALAIIIWQRKRIINKIEDFVEKNSEIHEE